MMTTAKEYGLYGEESSHHAAFRFHCETLFSRSSLHRFEIGLHRHENFLQILYVSGGDGDATLGGEVIAIKPPAIVILPPGFEHGFRFSRNITGIILTLIPTALSPSIQAVLRQHLKRPALICLHNDAAEIQTRCMTISEEYSGKYAAWDTMIEGHVTCLIVHIARIMQQSSLEKTSDRNSNRFDMLIRLIAQHIREQKQAEFYARELGISQTHLNRMVRQQCGTSLQRLIARQQLEIAQQELLFTVSTVQMVSTSLGFSDPAYFSRFFVRETGMTPRTWRIVEQERLSNAVIAPHQTSILTNSD